MWTGVNMGVFNESFSQSLSAHSCGLFSIKIKKN